MAPESLRNPAASESRVNLTPREKYVWQVRLGALRNKIVFSVCFLALIMILTNIKFILDLDVSGPGGIVAADLCEKISDGKVGLSQFLESMRLRFVALLAMGVLSFSIIIYLLVKKVLLPIDKVRRMLDEMSKGNLNVSALSHDERSLRELAASANEVSTNFQEVLLFIGTTVGNAKAAVDRMEDILDRTQGEPRSKDFGEQLRLLNRDLDALGEILKEFEFFHTHFDGRKVVANSQGRKASNL
jgi:methyl-accepting chemotaxis protein